ncbi:MAG: histidine phosphatase family protein [Candidatus Dormiibacterota bacterium]
MAIDGAAGAITTCYLLRHCDVENPRGVIYGHLPGYGLSARGREQARRLGLFLAARDPEAIYCSPLERAVETAELIQQELPARVTFQRSQELIEAEFGRYLQGVRYRQIPWRRPRWLAHMVWPGILPPDESVGAMHARVSSVIESGLRSHAGGAFVCISHGDPIQAYWATLDGRPPWALHRLQCSKGGLLELTFRGAQLLRKVYLSPAAVAAALESVSAPATT